MKIVIDARLINQTGVGRYIRNLTSELGIQDKANTYTVLLRKEDFQDFHLPNARWKKKIDNIRWHSLEEQLKLPGNLAGEKPDLVHIPYFNIPVLYSGPMIVTIHDLIVDHFDTGKASTLPYWKYLLRRIGYKVVMWVGLHRARKIIAVSESTKKELMEHYWIPGEKIVVTYEGIDENLKRNKEKGKPLIGEPYFLYVGNAYPHKNLETLLGAFQQFTVHSSQFTVKLVLVGKMDLFYERLKKQIANKSIVFFGEASDEQLVNLYDHAIALVCPSLMEGFGLPAIEALSRGTPVICSDIPVFHEMLKDYVTYFDPSDPNDIAAKLQNALKSRKPATVLPGYSWQTLARKTLQTYEDCIRL